MGMILKEKVCVVIPVYRAKDQILTVLSDIPPFVAKIIVVDDACPEGTGEFVIEHSKDRRVEVTFNRTNLGVGGAMVTGYQLALEQDCDIVVKLDGDGQMDPQQIPRLINPIVNYRADYSKGNRFDSLEDLEQMPPMRIFGNAVLSLMSKVSSGYWQINDPANGYTAIHVSTLKKINLTKVRRNWFFESDMLFRLSTIKAVVEDVPMAAKYGSEKSNLSIPKVGLTFPWLHLANLLKRIFYRYYLREWSAASFELPVGLVFVIYGIASGVNFWRQSSMDGVPSTAGEVMLSTIPILLGVQLLLAFLAQDISSEPSKPISEREL